MDFSLTEEQELLLASIRELITSNFPEEYFRTCDQTGTYPKEFMQALAENGISMLGVPEEFGGIPADYVTQMLALMEISKCGAPAFLITNGQCIHSMRRFGSAEQLRKTAESTLATGDPAYALALTEPGAGSDNNSATTTWTRKTARFILTAKKHLSPVQKNILTCWFWRAIRSQKILKKRSRFGGWTQINRA